MCFVFVRYSSSFFLSCPNQRDDIHDDKHNDREEVEPYWHKPFATNLVDEVFYVCIQGSVATLPDIHRLWPVDQIQRSIILDDPLCSDQVSHSLLIHWIHLLIPLLLCVDWELEICVYLTIPSFRPSLVFDLSPRCVTKGLIVEICNFCFFVHGLDRFFCDEPPSVDHFKHGILVQLAIRIACCIFWGCCVNLQHVTVLSCFEAWFALRCIDIYHRREDIIEISNDKQSCKVFCHVKHIIWYGHHKVIDDSYQK